MTGRENMVRSDFHMHTAFSTDSDAPVRAMLDAAVARGLDTVCITDHMDKDYPPDEELGEHPFLFDVEEYFRTMEAVREEYRGRLEVRIGIELGLQKHLGSFCRELTEKYPFDFVIGSTHLVGGKDPYYKKCFEGKTDEEVYRQAFRETLDNIRAFQGFDVLGHYDYVVRYGDRQNFAYSYSRFADETDAVLRELIEQGKGLEMNTGGLKYGLGFCNPHPDVMKRYRELGGEIVTVGSDAHKPEHVAYDFEKACEILKNCGFRYYARYRGRKPVFQPIG